MNKRLGMLALACGLAWFALWAGAQFLAASTALASGNEPAPAGAAPGPEIDARWLRLVRTLAADSTGQAPASAGPTIDYLSTDQVLAGRVSLASTVVVSIARGANTLATLYLTPFLDQNGFLYATNLSASNLPNPPQPGDIIWVSQASAAISLTVGTLNGLAWPLTDVVSGTAPAGAALQLFLYPFSDPATVITRSATADGGGNYQTLWSPGVDLRPQDSGFVLYAPDSSRRVYARYVAPFLRAQVGGFGIDGLAAPLSQVWVTVTTAAGAVLDSVNYNWTGTTGAFGICFGDCQYGVGVPAPKPGDIVWASAAGQVFSLTLPALTAHRTGNIISGQAPAGQAVTVARFEGPAPFFGGGGAATNQASVTATVTGAYSVTLPVVQPPDYGTATVSDSQGNEAYAAFAVPYIAAELGQGLLGSGYFVSGQVDDPTTPLTITIQGASGFLKSVQRSASSSTGHFQDPTSGGWTGIALEAGDLITVASAHGVQITDTIPLLTAQADVTSLIIAGQAPANAPVRINLSGYDVNFNPPGSDQTFVVTASAQGNYSFSFAPFGSFGPGAQGEVAYTGPQGRVAERAITALQTCLPHLNSAQVGGNQLSGAMGFNKQLLCEAATLTLLSGQGQTKFSQTVGTYPGQPIELALQSGGQPVFIQAGDHIRFENQGQVSNYLVPALSVNVDVAGGHISGQAPPSAALTLVVKNEGFFHGSSYSNVTLTTTANLQGAYQLNYPLRPGDQVEAWLGGTPRFYADRPAPVLHAWLYQATFEAWAAPFAAYTLTLQATRPVSLPTASSTADALGYVYRMGQGPWTFEPGDAAVFTAGTTGRTLAMPTLTALLGQDGQTVSGLGPAGQSLLVSLGGWTQAVTVSAQGHYSATFVPQGGGSAGRVIYTNSQGDQAGVEYSAARWEVTLGSRCINGQLPLPGVATTITLATAGGAVKDALPISAAFLGGRYNGCFVPAATVESGDRLSLVTPNGVVSFTVPVLTASQDGDHQLIRGTAPPNSLVSVFLSGLPPVGKFDAHRDIIAGADGSFAIDVSDLQLTLGAPARLIWQDALGNMATRSFTLQGRHTYLPFVPGP